MQVSFKKIVNKMVIKFHPAKGQGHMNIGQTIFYSKFYFRIKRADYFQDFAVNSAFDKFIPQRRT